MKLFISHSSKNKFFGEKIVDLLRNIGIKESEIIFTSNTAYGIPVGFNIFNWLKLQITDKPFVIYLLSEEYYRSVACLNEMGAAWIIENKHAAIFTPDFNLSSKEFQGGALDPREIGFYINDEERILSFIHLISEDFEISKNHIIISQSVKRFLSEINSHNEGVVELMPKEVNVKENVIKAVEIIKGEQLNEHKSRVAALPRASPVTTVDLFSKFINLISSKKLKDGELILLHYVIDTGRFKLMTGWQEQNEVDTIKKWEMINEINNKLSKNYASILKTFELRGFTEVSAITSSNNPKEIKIRDEISSQLLQLPDAAMSIINECITDNYFEYSGDSDTEEVGLPF